MIKIPPRQSPAFALWLAGFNAWEREAIMVAAARMAALDRRVDPARMVGWLIEAGAVTTLGLLGGRREVRR